MSEEIESEEIFEDAEEEVKSPKKKGKAKAASKKADKTSEDSDEKTKKKRRKKSTFSTYRESLNPSTLDMILEAIENLADGPKGSSIQAIRGYILHFYSVRPEFLKNMMKKALSKGLNSEVITRPKDQAEKSTVMTGRYLISKKKIQEDIEKNKPRARPTNLRQPKEVKKAKKKKRKHW